MFLYINHCFKYFWFGLHKLTMKSLGMLLWYKLYTLLTHFVIVKCIYNHFLSNFRPWKNTTFFIWIRKLSCFHIAYKNASFLLFRCELNFKQEFKRIRMLVHKTPFYFFINNKEAIIWISARWNKKQRSFLLCISDVFEYYLMLKDFM